jgi:two-component system sensor histidine kinase PilS (NtrC family)
MARTRYFLLPEPPDSFWLSLQYFNVTRLLIAALLLGAHMLSSNRLTVGEQNATVFLEAVLVYAGAALLFTGYAYFYRRWFYVQLSAQILVDIALLTIMVIATGGIRSGLTVLYLVPVAAGSILSPGMLALFFAALATLAILGEAGLSELNADAPEAVLFQAGLYGFVCFSTAVVFRRLAARLIRQEELASAQSRIVQHQVEINRMIISDLASGVMLVGSDSSVHMSNPAARQLLGLPEGRVRLFEVPGLANLAREFDSWRGTTTAHQVELRVRDPASIDDAGEATGKRLGVRFLHPGIDGAGVSGDSVIIIEDLGELETRAQQLKLAAMGRLTASIAHEIRNPLAAIGHAGALLAEDARDPLPSRLAAIIADNVARLDRIVENVLQLARREPMTVESIDLGPWLADCIREFCRDLSLAPGTVSLTMTGNPVVVFHQGHLRQVLLNLFVNATRYSSGAPASIRVAAGPDPDGEHIQLRIEDDGPGIAPVDRVHLFEPFFTTHSKGTGLGLFLAREFCVANRAGLTYEPGSGAGGERWAFVIRARTA